jgi:galactoside O-acetyltransferase
MYKSEDFMKLFKSLGDGVEIFQWALILKPEVIELSNKVRIDDYARIEGGKGLRIGKFVHICSFASIYGGGSAEISDYCGITQGARLITGTEQPTGVMTAAAPLELRDPMAGKIVMEPNSFIGANAVVLPNVVIGEGAIVAAGSVVHKDIEPWTIVGGSPPRLIRKRERLRFDLNAL